jgi:hypothetical protein
MISDPTAVCIATLTHRYRLALISASGAGIAPFGQYVVLAAVSAIFERACANGRDGAITLIRPVGFVAPKTKAAEHRSGRLGEIKNLAKSEVDSAAPNTRGGRHLLRLLLLRRARRFLRLLLCHNATPYSEMNLIGRGRVQGSFPKLRPMPDNGSLLQMNAA